MFIVGDHSYSYYPEIVSLREGGQIPDCLTDLSEPYPTRLWTSSAGGAIPEARVPEAGIKVFLHLPFKQL